TNLRPTYLYTLSLHDALPILLSIKQKSVPVQFEHRDAGARFHSVWRKNSQLVLALTAESPPSYTRFSFHDGLRGAFRKRGLKSLAAYGDSLWTGAGVFYFSSSTFRIKVV